MVRAACRVAQGTEPDLALALFHRLAGSYRELLPREEANEVTIVAVLSACAQLGTWTRSVSEDASPDYNLGSEATRFSSWAAPDSLAVTRGILVNSAGDPV